MRRAQDPAGQRRAEARKHEARNGNRLRISDYDGPH